VEIFFVVWLFIAHINANTTAVTKDTQASYMLYQQTWQPFMHPSIEHCTNFVLFDTRQPARLATWRHLTNDWKGKLGSGEQTGTPRDAIRPQCICELKLMLKLKKTKNTLWRYLAIDWEKLSCSIYTAVEKRDSWGRACPP